ncbi:hypothetical protein TRFO_00877 [Tritrichomonas foetus]|uniref:BACK domain-containing protein n=1 Tax=Tritrichomonas foetus TaxID=1144522 RepID=A0A1J4L276_9EUKA|nr:hypothetical protein TRFO_00877 [Tritrichomonas foetus]|eukprot:OHT17615.1 hypothetical protein TRFO_00877 [Tritrichomonas foetus]
MEEKNIEFILNINNIKNIPLNKYAKDFTFVVNGQKYETSRFIADLLSPKIANLHFIDESIQEYHLNTEQQGDFEHFINLVGFEKNCYSETEINFFVELFIELGNNEYINLNPQFFEPITIDNVISRIQNKLRLSLKFTNSSIDFRFIQNEISFISKHFYEIINQEDETRKENLISLGIEILEMILQNDNLKLYDEDSLFNFILRIVGKNEEFSISKCIHIFEYVKFEYLSQESIKTFISIFDLEYLNESIWLSICQRLLLTPNLKLLQGNNINSVNDNDNDQNTNRYIIKSFQIPFQ